MPKDKCTNRFLLGAGYLYHPSTTARNRAHAIDLRKKTYSKDLDLLQDDGKRILRQGETGIVLSILREKLQFCTGWHMRNG